MALKWKEYELNESAVDDISETIDQFLKGACIERRNILRSRLTMEELLLRILDKKEHDQVNLGIGKQFGRTVISLKYQGNPFDPTEGESDNWNDRILVSVGLAPSWSYRGGTNTLSLKLDGAGGHGTLFYIFVAALAAFLLGAAGYFLPQGLKTGIDEILLAPLMKGFLGLLNTFAGIMIAFTIMSGLLGVGDSAALGKIGKGLLLRLFIISLIVSAFALCFASVFLHPDISADGSGGASQLSQISGMIFGILPTDPVSPFLNCNTMQIIVIALSAGTALLTLTERGQHLRVLVEEGTTLTQLITSGICKMVPLFVFTALLRQIWSGATSQLLSLWKPLLLIISCGLITATALFIFTAIQVKCSPVMLLKKLMPPFLVAFTTASSISAFSTGMDTCEKKLGVERSFLEFALPVGSVIYMPVSLCMLSVLSCSLADIYGLQTSPAWFVMAWLAATLLSIAVPPIPGAALTIYSILFAQLGIPSGALLLAAALDVITDFFDTGFNVLLLNLEMVREAYIMGRIDRKILTADR